MKLNEFLKENSELLDKAQKCKTLDEFLNLAKENNVDFEDISLEKAYSLLNGDQDLDEDLLDSVAGGKKKNVTPPGYPTEEYTQSVGLTKNDLTPEAYYK